MKNASFFYFDILNKVSTSNDKFYSTFKIQPRFHAKGRFSDISVLQKYKKSHRFHIDIRNFWNHLRTSFKSVPFSVGPWNWYTWVALAHGLLVLSRDIRFTKADVSITKTDASIKQTDICFTKADVSITKKRVSITKTDVCITKRHNSIIKTHTTIAKNDVSII